MNDFRAIMSKTHFVAICIHVGSVVMIVAFVITGILTLASVDIFANLHRVASFVALGGIFVYIAHVTEAIAKHVSEFLKTGGLSDDLEENANKATLMRELNKKGEALSHLIVAKKGAKDDLAMLERRIPEVRDAYISLLARFRESLSKGVFNFFFEVITLGDDYSAWQASMFDPLASELAFLQKVYVQNVSGNLLPTVLKREKRYQLNQLVQDFPEGKLTVSVWLQLTALVGETPASAHQLHDMLWKIRKALL